MRASSHIGAALLAALAVSSCSGGGAAVGENCVATSGCAADLQCFEGICTPECDNYVDCGDGYRCETDGQCTRVESLIGDACASEVDCGPGQVCRLDADDPDDDGVLAGTCQAQATGLVTGGDCAFDGDCRSGLCAIGVCSQLCAEARDCPPETACAIVPRLIGDEAPIFSGCLPSTGLLVDDIPVDSAAATLRIPVPSTARSFAVLSRIDDPDQLVGATRVASPSGRLLFATPLTQEDFYQNPIRYEASFGVSTLFVPNTPTVDLELGVYLIDVSSLLPIGGTGTAVPQVRVIYKLASTATLDLHFHFLNLGSHPCSDAFDAGRLDATSAAFSDRFQGYLARIGDILAPAGITVGTVTYQDVRDRADLDGLSRERLGDLLSLSQGKTGINVFIARSISPTGVQALSGGTPGPPATPGTEASGVVVGADTLCYRSWDVLARSTAHALARHMGLFHNRDPEGFADSIPDSDDDIDNLMFFGEYGGTELSEGQADVLRRYPGLR